MLLQNTKSPVHQLIIIRLITGCSLKLRDSACLCKCDPDLRYQYTFYVQTCNIHFHILLFIQLIAGISQSLIYVLSTLHIHNVYMHSHQNSLFFYRFTLIYYHIVSGSVNSFLADHDIFLSQSAGLFICFIFSFSLLRKSSVLSVLFPQEDIT